MINTSLLVTLIILIVPVGIIAILVSMMLYDWKIKRKHQIEKQFKEQEQIEQEEEMERNAIVAPGNPLLESLSKIYNLIFCGGLGSGKTLAANLTTKYIRDKQEMYDWENRRMLKYINPAYIEKVYQMAEDGKMPVYSNIDLTDVYTGASNIELWPYLTQQKMAMENGIYFMDEIGTKLGKDQYWIQGKHVSDEYQAATESARFARQDANIRFIATEQNEDNIYKPIREKGFAIIRTFGVTHWITEKGKKKQWWKNFWLNALPGIFTLDVTRLLRIELGFINKLKTFAKCLLPAYFLQPKAYYSKKIEIINKIKFEYSMFKLKLEFQEKQYYLVFTNYDIYKYNTRGHKEIYQSRFDSEGNRKHVFNTENQREDSNSKAENTGEKAA